MTTPCQIMRSPVFPPYTCIRCGNGAGPFRDFFIDIGVSNELAVDLRDHGAIYFCNECALNLANDLLELITNPPVGILPYERRDRFGNFEVVTGSVQDATGDDSGSEQSSDELQGTGELSEGTDSVSDDEPDFREYVDPRVDRTEVVELGRPIRGRSITF